jgi:iron complex outermembrane recepter protein
MCGGGPSFPLAGSSNLRAGPLMTTSLRIPILRVVLAGTCCHLWCSVGTPLVFGASPPTEQSPAPPAPDETIELSPFVVQSSRDTGYVATDTVAGSRLNTPLVDTSAAIDVMTLEFLEDIAATTVEEAMEYAINADNDMNIDGGDNAQFEFAAGRINVRGLQATRTRNFFPIPYSADVYNLDRVEEQRGPNSILFGIGSPAGVINVNTKRAVLGHAIRRGTVMFNSEGGYRGAFDFNVPAGRSLAVRLNAVYSDMDDALKHFAYRETKAGALAATWKVSDRIQFRGEMEWTRENSVIAKQRSNPDRVSRWLEAPVARYTFANWQQPGVTIAQYGIASLGTSQRVTYVDNNDTLMNFRNLHTTAGNGIMMFEENQPGLWDRSVNDGGPGQLRDNRSFAGGAAMDVRLGARTFLELAANHSKTRTIANMFSDTGLRGSPNLRLSDNVTPNPYAGMLYLEGDWRRWRKIDEYTSYRATLSHELDFDKFGNYRVALMHEIDDQYYFNRQQREVWTDANGMGLFNSNPTNTNNVVHRRHYITREGNWADYHVSSPAFGLINGMQVDTGQIAYSTWRNANAGQTYDNRYTTLLAALQARYLGNRLVVGAGLRHDKLRQRQYAVRDENNQFYLNEFNEQVANMDRWSDNDYSGNTKTLGAVFHVTPNVRLMYNHSNNFGVPSSARNRYPDNGPADNTEGEGYDFGVGFRLWNNKVSGRITRFVTDSKNIYRSGYNLTNINNNLLNAVVSNQAVTGVTQAQADAMYISGTGGIVDQHVEGYEFSVTANLTSNWRLRAGYSYTDGYQTNSYPDQREYLEGDPNGRLGGFGGLTFFENPAWANLPLAGATSGNTIGTYIRDFKEDMAEEFAVDGVALARNRPHKASLFTNYSFSEGVLKGLLVGGGARYQSAAQLGIGFDANGTPFALKGNEYWTGTAMLGYTFRQLGRLKRVRVQLNVDNLFDFSDYIITARNPSTMAITKINYLAPRSAKLSASFSF